MRNVDASRRNCPKRLASPTSEICTGRAVGSGLPALQRDQQDRCTGRSVATDGSITVVPTHLRTYAPAHLRCSNRGARCRKQQMTTMPRYSAAICRCLPLLFCSEACEEAHGRKARLCSWVRTEDEGTRRVRKADFLEPLHGPAV